MDWGGLLIARAQMGLIRLFAPIIFWGLVLAAMQHFLKKVLPESLPMGIPVGIGVLLVAIWVYSRARRRS